MKFLQIHTFYPLYLAKFYERNPDLASAPFDEQIAVLLQDGFGACHMFAPYMRERGYDAQLAIANCLQSQLQWLQEKGTSDVSQQNWMGEIALQQIEILKPDILYLSDPITFDSNFIRNLSYKPSLILGWRAASIPQSTDWTEFDVILSNHKVSLQRALELGVKSTEYFMPGFPAFLADVVKEEPKQWDVIFSGQVSPEHTKRLESLKDVAKASLGVRGEFSIGYFLASGQANALPAGVHMYKQEPRWGIEMYRTLKRGKIGLNVHIDLAERETGNMRMFETTGIGTFLLTDDAQNIQKYFQPGVEIETFRDSRELIEKVYYYLEHSEEREAIARRGQERCLRDYSMSKMTVEFDRIIHKHLTHRSARGETKKSSLQTPQMPTQSTDLIIKQAVEQLNANNNTEALSLLEKAIANQPHKPALNYGKALALARLGNTKEAIESLNHLLSAVPEHPKGKQLLAELCTASAQDVQIMLQQAVELLNSGKKVEALRLAENAASFGVFVPEMHYIRAVCLGSVGRYEEALEAAKQELALNPSHVDAQKQVESLTKALIKPKPPKIPADKRSWGTTIPRELMMSIQNATHNYSYRGVPLLKNPFDFALYPLLIWNVKPGTIIEIGSKSGGSALWFGDLLESFGLDGRVYSIDIVKVTKVFHQRVTFLEGDGQALHQTLSAELMRSLPRPLLVIEDADHSYETSKAVLDFFHPYFNPGEYIVIEDGIISDIIQDSSYNRGPHRALKAFLAEHRDEYEVEGDYCDFFGYNVTWATNGYLKKIQKSLVATSEMSQSVEENPENEVPIIINTEDWAEFQELLQTVRPYTMLSEARLYSLFSLAKRVCEENIPGNFVECGVAAGGSAALMAAVIKRYTKQPRLLYAFDSFEGLPPPTRLDKCNGIPAEAMGWGAGTCAAPESNVINLCSMLGVSGIVRTVKGYFQDTLPEMRDFVGMISLLHMDGDWYESTKTILNNLYDRVVNDGFIQVDDYGYWEGCRQALHEFETLRQIEFDINQIDETGVWFSCPDQFPLNSDLEFGLVAEFAEDDPVASGIQSQMSPNERFQLYYVLCSLLPKTSSPLRFVEIGSFAGSSLFLTCQALQRMTSQVQGFAIEPGGLPQFYEVLKHLKDEVTHLQMFSHQAVSQLKQIFEQDRHFPCFMFIDGDHSYEGVRQDILDYFPLLSPGGIMVFHDYLPPLNEKNQEAILFHHGGNEPGIRQACQELMENTYGCEVIDLPLLYPTDPTQSQAYLPIIPGVFSTIRAYRKPQS